MLSKTFEVLAYQVQVLIIKSSPCPTASYTALYRYTSESIHYSTVVQCTTVQNKTVQLTLQYSTVSDAVPSLKL
jgi:hypothetical protein